MLRIAVATASDALAQKVCRSMGQRAARIDRFESFTRCVTSLASRRFDLIAIDYASQPLQEFDRLSIAQNLPKSTPTIAFVSDGPIDQSVKLLDAGVDRCMPISFDEKHFSAVVRALTRRSLGLTSSVTQYGALSFNHETKCASIDGEQVALTTREAQVLEILLRRVGQITSKEAFIEAMGPRSIDLNSSAVEVYVHRIRKKISDEVLPIRSIKRCGYFLKRFTPTLAPTPRETDHALILSWV